MAKKKNNSKIPLPIVIIICAVLLYASYTSISTLALAIFGDSVMGIVDSYSNRRDDTRAEENRSRTVSKGYSFIAKGKVYRGYVTYLSDEAWPSLDKGETRQERICYLSFFPYINKPAMLSDFDRLGELGIIYHIFTPIGCLILFLLVTRTGRKGKRKKKGGSKAVAKASTQRQAQIKEKRSNGDMYCQNCGNKLLKEAAFCSNCGVKTPSSADNTCKACGIKLPEDSKFCIGCGKPINLKIAVTMEPMHEDSPVSPQKSSNMVGFSDRYNSPELLAVAQEKRKSSIGCMWIMFILPLIGFPIAGLLMDDFPLGEAIIIGVGTALILLFVNLLALGSSKKPIWEGVVVNKYSNERYQQRDSNETYTEYTVVIKTDAGKKKTIVERRGGGQMYDYLSVGDRVRYHPRFGTFEKYDKSKDRIIYCNVCTRVNPIQNDRCSWCKNLLFK